MNIVIINNNTKEVTELAEIISGMINGCRIVKFTDPLLSVKYIWYEDIDIIFIEEKMRPVSGSELVKVIRKRRKDIPCVIMVHNNALKFRLEEQNIDKNLIKYIKKSEIKKQIIMSKIFN